MNLTESEEHARLEACLKDILGKLQAISTRLSAPKFQEIKEHM